MRKLVYVATVGLFSMLPLTAHAAPVAGYEGLYAAVATACSLPDGTLPACEAAINAYAGALVAAGVDIGVANDSFIALRQEVFAANAADEAFQTDVDALFELLLPDSGAIGAPAPAFGDPVPANGGAGGPLPASPA